MDLGGKLMLVYLHWKILVIRLRICAIRAQSWGSFHVVGSLEFSLNKPIVLLLKQIFLKEW